MFLKFSSNHNCTLENTFFGPFHPAIQKLSALLIELFNQMNPKECTSMKLNFFKIYYEHESCINIRVQEQKTHFYPLNDRFRPITREFMVESKN